MSAQLHTAVTELSQVGEARRAVARLAQGTPLADARRSDLAIVTTELATNLARHAVRGRLLAQVIRSEGTSWIEVLAIDEGPGMADLHRNLRDGYSSGGSPGTGFGAVRRLADVFDATSLPGKGTVVMARFRVDEAADDTPFVVGAVSLPAPHEVVCGDAWRVACRGRDLAVLVVDGVGHGPLAADAAQRAVEVFDADPFADDQPFFDRAHAALIGSRGAVAARTTVRDRAVGYAGVGNISGALVSTEGHRGLPSQNGTVGADQRRQVTSTAYAWPARGVLVMHSDGITSRWSLAAYPGLVVRHPAIIAAVVARDFIRGRDDVTVVVVGTSARW